MRYASSLVTAWLVKASASVPASSRILEDGDRVPIESFSTPQFSWVTRNDPVMGGQSTSEFHVDDDEGTGVFDGQVKIVTFLQAPGFIELEASGSFPDVSACEALALVVKSTTDDYQGYRISFGTKHDPASWMPWIRGYKASFSLESTEEFQTVVIPFQDFTLKWDPATGNALKTCALDTKLCPDQRTLEDMKQLSIMGEGVEGLVHLEIQSIAATDCGSTKPSMPSDSRIVKTKFLR